MIDAPAADREPQRSSEIPTALDRASRRVRDGLEAAAKPLSAIGVPVPEFRGRLLRPLVAYAAAPDLADSPEASHAFWSAVLAVQMAHEASLLHDDVIDGAPVRRGLPTLAARAGIASALVQGDHVLTGAYRAAVMSGSLPFVALFSRAVERTVAGERRQAEMPSDLAAAGGWRDIVLGKSGELFGCALAIGALFRGTQHVEPLFELGRRVGMVYQMVDDLLDYCPGAMTGKQPLADYRTNRWTWPLGDAKGLAADRPDGEVTAFLFGGRTRTPGRQMLARLEDEMDGVTREMARALGPVPALQALIEEWRMRARTAVRGEESRLVAIAGIIPRDSDGASENPRPPVREEWAGYLGQHGRSFRFATSFMPPAERGQVAAVYAWCRYTDDLVDRSDDADADLRLDHWLSASREAFDGRVTGIELLDDVMGRTRAAGVPFTYASELIAGMRMDLRHRPYANLEELQLYTWRAAGTVGLWMSELYGVRAPWAAARAAALGQAMQLTNIIRDVGEDLARGRLYLPLDRLAAHGLSPDDLLESRETGAQLGEGWPALLEELMDLAERDYRRAAEAFPELPGPFRRAATVASAVYGGIHDAIRRIGYDTLNRRAATTRSDKMLLGARALMGIETRRSSARLSVPQFAQAARA